MYLSHMISQDSGVEHAHGEGDTGEEKPEPCWEQQDGGRRSPKQHGAGRSHNGGHVFDVDLQVRGEGRQDCIGME